MKHKEKYNKFELTQVKPKQVRKLFKLLKNSSSKDINGLSNKIIKISREALIGPVTHLLNQCFTTKTWPTKWKINKILPCAHLSRS